MSRRIPADEVQIGDYIYPGMGELCREVVQVRRGGNGDVLVVYAIGGLMEKMDPMHPHQPVEIET